MLLIGDIHINARMKKPILDRLENMVSSHMDESHFVFLGDYVYHFAYDRRSLLELFRFFVELYRIGKHVYVLAGNHDWIADHFVYEEAKQAFDIVMGSPVEESGSLYFITEPTRFIIEGEDVLFFPYNTSLDVNDADIDVSVSEDPRFQHISAISQELVKSEHKREKTSGIVNAILLSEVINRNPKTTVTVIHHYYVEGITFPGQRGRFSFKDVSLAKQWCDVSCIRMISGHLHQPFVYKNYLCLGSLWSTSPLEINHLKVYAHMTGKKLCLYPCHINYYLRLDGEDGVVDKEKISVFLKGLENNLYQSVASNEFFDCIFEGNFSPEFERIALQVLVAEMDYGQIDTYVDNTVSARFDSIRLKKQQQGLHSLMQKLDTSGKNLESGFQDWKNILQDYIAIKYKDEQDVYEKLLRDMRVLS